MLWNFVIQYNLNTNCQGGAQGVSYMKKHDLFSLHKRGFSWGPCCFFNMISLLLYYYNHRDERYVLKNVHSHTMFIWCPLVVAIKCIKWERHRVLLVNEWLLFKAKGTMLSWRKQATFRWCHDNYNYDDDDDQLLVGFLYY